LTVQRYGCRVNQDTFLEHYDEKDLARVGPHMPLPDPLSTCGVLPPQIDRLYIDMNGIIHGCSHNNQPVQASEDDSSEIGDQLVSGRTEDDVFRDICYYLDRIVRDIAQPKELLYLAIDGVAPRAKLNQQRSRRYRSAKEGEIERSVYDAHQQQLESYEFGLDEDGDDATQKSNTSVMYDTWQGRTAVKEVEPGRFTGKFETQTKEEEMRNLDSMTFVTEPLASATEEENEEENEEKFHRNAITPGTPFFQRCTKHLEHFIQRKISTDPAWKDLTVILSGSNTPGEGEHKIMQFMREQQTLPDYQANMRHCIVGQDGDLVMLGLATHEPNLFLLRERVIFSEKKKVPLERLAERIGLGVYLHNAHFELLHMNILRDYLAMEFAASNILPGSPYDLEHIIDDFVFMTFLVGNDFLPHLPALDIGDDAFDLLFYTYRDQRKRWTKEQPRGLPYLTNSGEIVSGKRLEKFLSTVGSYESRWHDFKESTTDLDKVRKMEAKFGRSTTPSDEILEAKEQSDRLRYLQILRDSAKNIKDRDLSSSDFTPAMSNPDLIDMADEEDTKEQEGLLDRFGSLLHASVQDGAKMRTESVAQINDRDFKGRYYADKFGFSPFDKEKHLALRKAYVEGLVWNLQYYYRGTVSWEWFYPYHYGPMISDLVGLDKMLKEVSFGKPGSPLKPFEQLMACMPASNANILPKPYRWLMTDKSSPLAEFYPESFTVDMNGKRWPWEAVVLLPFIDSAKLRKAASQIDQSLLTEEEKNRNMTKEDMVYFRDDSLRRFLPAATARGKSFEELSDCKTVAQSISKTRWLHVPYDKSPSPLFRPQLQKGVEVPLDGLPTLRDGSVLGMRRKFLSLNVHGTLSRYQTSLLELANELPEVLPVSAYSDHLIGTTVFINYPHLVEAFVTAVSDSRVIIRGKQPPKFWTPLEAAERKKKIKNVCKPYLVGDQLTGTGGIAVAGLDYNVSEIILSVRPLKGTRVLEDGTIGKVFAKFEIEVPSFVTSWKPVRLDRRLEGLPSVLEKDPFQASAGRTVRTRSLPIVDSPSLQISGKQNPQKPKAVATIRSFSTWNRLQIEATPSTIVRQFVVANRQNGTRRFHTGGLAASQFQKKASVRGNFLAVGALALTWFFSAGVSAASIFTHSSKAFGRGSLPSLKPELPHLSTAAASSVSQSEPTGQIDDTSAPALHFAHGTTTLAFIFKGGIIVAVDSRASLGTFIGSKTVQKVLPINPKMLGTMAGGAADCSYFIRKLAARAALHEAQEERPMSIARASRMLSSVLYANRGAGLSMGTMIMGYDEDSECETGANSRPRIFYVDDRGTRIEGDMFSVGSGSTYALAVLDGQEDRFSLSTEQAVRLAVQAIRYATFRDGSSGGFINVYHIAPGGEWKRVFRHDIASILDEGGQRFESESLP